MRRRVHLIISGRVQGVFFRAETYHKALQLGIAGWVRNTPKGHVEAVFEGDEERLRNILSWCRLGPPSAAVSEVVDEWSDFKGEFNTFSIRY